MSVLMFPNATLAVLQDRNAKVVDDTLLAREIIGELAQKLRVDEDTALDALIANKFDSTGAEIYLATTTQQSESHVAIFELCAICCENNLGHNTFSLKCGHIFCNDCWRRHVEVNLASGPAAAFSCSCMNSECKEPIRLGHVKHLLGDEGVQRYRQFATEQIIAQSGLVRTCPNRRCAQRLVLDNRGGFFAECPSCSTPMCPQCGDICHDPAPCNVVAAFKSRTQQQQERFSNVADSAEEWLSQYSKRCPKCTVPIEKNRGCNHMSCTQCKHQFCWLCLAQWAPIRGCKCPQSAAELNRNALDQGHIEMTVRQAIGRVRTNGDRMKQSLLGHAGVRWLVSRCYSIVEHSHIVNMYLAQPVRTLEPKMTELLNDVEISLAPCARQTCDPSYTDCMMQLIANHIAELRVIVQGAAFNLLAPERPHEREMHNRDEDRDERLRLAHRRRRERNQAVHQAAVNGRRRHAIVEGMTERPYPAAPFGMPAQTNVFAPEEIDLFMQQLLGAEIQQHIPTAPEPPAPTWRRPMLFQPGPYPQPQPQPQHQPQPQPQPQLPAAPAPPLSRPPLSLAQQRAAQQWHEMQRYMHIMQSAPSVQAVQSMQAMQAAQEQMQRLENERQMRERQNEQWMQQFEDMLGTAMPVEPLLQLPQLQADVADLLQEPVAPVEPFVGLPAPYMPEWAEFADAEEVVIPETPLPIRRRGRPPGAKNRPKPQEPVVVPPTVPPTVRSRVHHWPGPFTADHIPATTATTATAIPTRTSDAGLSHASAAPTVAARSTSTTDLLQSIQQHRPATMTLPQRPFFETGAALLGGSDVTTEPRSVVGFGKRRYEESTPAAVSPATTSPIPSTFITPPTTSTDIPAPWATMCLLDTDQLHEELADDAVRYRARRAVSPEVTITRVSYPTSATPSTAELAFPPPTSTPAAAVDDMMETSWWWDNWTM